MADAALKKAIALHDLGQYEESLAACEKALELRSNFIEAFYQKGKTLADLEQYTAAVSAFDRTLELDKNSYPGAF